MRLLIGGLLVGLGLGLSACGRAEAPGEAAKPGSAAEQDARIAVMRLDFDKPVLLDSSAYVLYALPLRSADQSGKSGSFKSSYSERMAACWNIAFYQPLTGKYHLLDPDRKMLIHSYGSPETPTGAAAHSGAGKVPEQAVGPADRLLYYLVSVTDFNQDGQLNEDDPRYLFVSDRAGRNFRQISPDSLTVTGWEVLPGTSKVLIHAQKDVTGDRLFDDDDETVPLAYDLRDKGLARPIFDADFRTLLKTRLSTQWVTKQ